MKFKLSQPKPRRQRPVIGDVKESIRFALFPVKTESNVVWLERYRIVKVWQSNASSVTGSMGGTTYFPGWVIKGRYSL